MTTPSPITSQHDPTQGQQYAQSAVNANPAAGLSADPNAQSPSISADPPKDVQQALISCVTALRRQTDIVRRHKIREMVQAIEYWQGNQNLIWNARDWRWSTPFETAVQQAADQQDQPEYYITNIYLALGLSVISAIHQSPSNSKFVPVSAMSQDDVSTAKAANRLIKLIHKNNQMDILRIYLGYLMWTQGFCAGYVRFKVDGDRFGYRPQEIWSTNPVKVMPERLQCPCGGYADMENGIPGAGARCPECQSSLGPANYAPPVTLNVPGIQRIQMVPNGAETITFYGGLNVAVPPEAEDFSGIYYLILDEEVNKAPLRAAYVSKADVISGGLIGGGEDSYERIQRLSLLDNFNMRGGATPWGDLVTYRRAWLKPEAFWTIDDPVQRQKLLDMYPDGVMVALAGQEFLEARNERMGDHWRVMRAMPGQGMYTQSLGKSLIDVQTQVNDSVNVRAQHRTRAAIPPIFTDSRYIDEKKLASKPMQAGSFTPILPKAGGPATTLESMIFQPKFSVDPVILEQDQQELINLGQFVTGALPSILGAGQSHLDTASAYSQAQASAMGRLALVNVYQCQFQAEIDTLAVQCAQQNRVDDVEQVMQPRDGEFASDWIHLAELQGNAVAEPEVSAGLPQTYAQVRSNIISIMNSQDQQLIAKMSDPINSDLINQYIGIPGLKNPEADNEAKQFMEIDILVASAPEIDPQTGVPTSTVPIDPLVDNDAVHIATIQAWAVGETGINCKYQNPGGYANVMAHLLEHMHNMSLKAQSGLDGEPLAGHGVNDHPALPKPVNGNQGKPANNIPGGEK